MQAIGASVEIKYDTLSVPWWHWALLAVVVVGLILFDLLGHVINAHEPTFKEATKWTAFYVTLAIIFGLVLWIIHGSQFMVEYYAGYLTEYSLSLDNIFVFIIVISSFKIARKYQQKVLLFGIVIALILRLLFIIAGAALIAHFVWVFFIFGAWMVYTAIGQIWEGLTDETDTDDSYKEGFLVKIVKRFCAVTHEVKSAALVVKINQHKKAVTPLFICILAIGSIDLIFAIDSIPAIFGLTKQPYIVFAANAFALLGLRQIFFLVDGLLDRLIYLHFGLAAILGFIGYKQILHAAHGYGWITSIPEPGLYVSVGFILLTLLCTVIASSLKARHTR